MRDHGGDIDAAIRRFGGAAEDWVDLSTGINPRPYPLPDIPPHAWAALPTAADMASLTDAARAAYGAAAPILPLAGAQAAIQLIPRLAAPGRARVLGPTYNEHAAALVAGGWTVETAQALSGLGGAELAVVVNPNNPDGRRFEPGDLRQLARDVELLVVDESFADADPDIAIAPEIGSDDAILALRSFGKFYGLAGLRLGFAIGGSNIVDALKELAGPWPVSGPAIAVGRTALADEIWRLATIARLDRDAARLDRLAAAAGWREIGGARLFRLYETGAAAAAQARLAENHVWSRIFPYAPGWVRLGLPDGETQWAQVEAAFTGLG